MRLRSSLIEAVCVMQTTQLRHVASLAEILLIGCWSSWKADPRDRHVNSSASVMLMKGWRQQGVTPNGFRLVRRLLAARDLALRSGDLKKGIKVAKAEDRRKIEDREWHPEVCMYHPMAQLHHWQTNKLKPVTPLPALGSWGAWCEVSAWGGETQESCWPRWSTLEDLQSMCWSGLRSLYLHLQPLSQAAINPAWNHPSSSPFQRITPQLH